VVPVWQLVGITGGAAATLLVLLFAAFGVAKAARSAWRRRHGSPVRQIADGWRDILDRVRDTGVKVLPGSPTFREQAAKLGLAPVSAMVASTERAMFGPDTPDAPMVAEYWRGVDTAKTALLAGRGWLRRLGVHMNPRSLASPARRLG